MSSDQPNSRTVTSTSVPEPRERRRTSLSYILFSLFVTVLGVVVMAGLGVFYASQQLAAEGPLKEAKTVAIERGMSTSQIAAKLESEEVISNHRIFFLASVVHAKLGRSLKAGEYQFDAGDSMREVLDKLASGKALVYKLTVPEGLTSEQVLARLAAHEAMTGDLPQSLPEGVLLPDTYVFNRGMGRMALIEKMRDAQKKLLDELWEKRVRGLPVKTKQDALILASIVEKETGVPEERSRVAAVFHNRLLQNIRLQSDPTIIYGITGGKGKLDRPIRRSDIDRKTAYNTYQIDGLPPTPIANPGRDAIAAVLKPAVVDDLYFVADGSGGHVFAKTLGEHQANVKRWRKIEADSQAAAATTPDPVETDRQPVAEEPVVQTAVEAATPAEEATEQATDTGGAGTTEPQAPALPASNAAGEEIPVAGAEPESTQPAPDTTAVDNDRVAQGKVPLPRRKPAVN